VTHAVTGMLILFSMLGVSIISGGIFTERVWRTVDRLRATPVRPVQIIVGKAVPYGAVLLAQQATIVGYGVLVLGVPVRRPGLLLLAGLAWAATLLCAGAMLATIVRSYAELSAVVDIGGLFLTVLGGAMVPLVLMPAWLQSIAPISPGYWAFNGLRSAVSGDTAMTLRSVAILAAMAAASGAAAAWRIARGWGRGRLL
jgi:ABC-2 type transport system permease protein